MAIAVNEQTFEQEVLKSTAPVLVDFWATWCGPCRMLAPVVEEVEEALAGKLKVCKVDVDENFDLAGQFGVSSIPTLIVFKNGEAVNRAVGYMPKEEVEALVNTAL